jgi:hypothetical protein
MSGEAFATTASATREIAVEGVEVPPGSAASLLRHRATHYSHVVACSIATAPLSLSNFQVNASRQVIVGQDVIGELDPVDFGDICGRAPAATGSAP